METNNHSCLHLHLWEGGTPGGNPHKHGGNIQNTHRKVGSNPDGGREREKEKERRAEKEKVGERDRDRERERERETAVAKQSKL